MVDNILYRQAEDPFGVNQIQLVLPKKAIHEVLDKIHCLVYSGHLGRRKTYKTMSQRFYRPFLGKDVDKYVQSCDICQKIKSSGQQHKTELKIITPSRTNELVATDLAGPFNSTVRGNKYLDIINDCYSKYLVCRAIPDKETSTVTNAMLESWFWTFGIPERILSDRGKEFRSKLMENICSTFDVERMNTTPGHPQCDGQSEKSVQQIKKMIRAHVAEDQENWDLGLAQLCFAYNTSVHETTGLTPFEIMFGRNSIIPIDLIYPNRLEILRETIKENHTVLVSAMRPALIDKSESFEQVEVLKDVDPDEIEPRCPAAVQSYMEEKRNRFKSSQLFLVRKA